MSTELKPRPLSDSRDSLAALVEQALADAAGRGADAAYAGVSTGQGMSLTVRLGEVETVEHIRDRGLGVTVYFGQRSGSASTSDLSPEAVRDTVRAACTIARYTAEDPCNGLPERDRLAWTVPELDLNHPWHPDMEEAIDIAVRCETAARNFDARIDNSEGATLTLHEGLEVCGNSLGFLGSVAASRHGLSCSVIAQDDGGMQRDYWYTVARDAAALRPPEEVGRVAGQRALRRLGARKLTTREAPVIYEAQVAGSLLSHFVSAIRGPSLYRRASFLLDRIGQPVFADHVHIHEQPHLPRAMGSAPFDNEGVATRARDIVSQGVLRDYVLDTYSARKLGRQTTANAGGVHNLTIDPGPRDLAGLLREMGTGLLVTELIGFGVNIVTGDYSRGASGYWVEGGEIQYPVEEITIAGNLGDIYRGLEAVGNDVDTRGNIRTGSILISNMTVAGS